MKTIRWDLEAMEMVRRSLSLMLCDVDDAFHAAHLSLKALEDMRHTDDSGILCDLGEALSGVIRRFYAHRSDAYAFEDALREATVVFEETEAEVRGQLPVNIEEKSWQIHREGILNPVGPGSLDSVIYSLIASGRHLIVDPLAVVGKVTGSGGLWDALAQGGAQTSWWDASAPLQSAMGVEKVGIRAGVMDAALPGEFIQKGM